MLKKKRFKQKKNWLSLNWNICIPLVIIILIFWRYKVLAQSMITKAEIDTLREIITNDVKQELQIGLNTMWVVFTGCLVFFMNAGFGLLEAGLCRYKNTVNILSKNLTVFIISTLVFYAVGFGLMFGDGNLLFGLQGFFLTGVDNTGNIGEDYIGVFSSLNWAATPDYAKFFFELVFAGTAATILSGALAERIRFIAFIIFTPFLVGFIYPTVGHWIWGGGWLKQLGFQDFAGSTVVHIVGGCAALAGVNELGSRLNKYNQLEVNWWLKRILPTLKSTVSTKQNDTFQTLGLHNLTLVFLGGFILWLGWFGFNPGSTLELNPEKITRILLNTNLAAATSAMSMSIINFWYLRKIDLTMTINGVLAGLVSITGACAYVGIFSAIVIGFMAGIIVFYSIRFFERMQVDDPVGAISVHLMGGIWGTLAIGLFSNNQNDFPGLFFGGGFNLLAIQLIGIFIVITFVYYSSWLIWRTFKVILKIRVDQDIEQNGLDFTIHGMGAYNGFILRNNLIQNYDELIAQQNYEPLIEEEEER